MIKNILIAFTLLTSYCGAHSMDNPIEYKYCGRKEVLNISIPDGNTLLLDKVLEIASENIPDHAKNISICNFGKTIKRTEVERIALLKILPIEKINILQKDEDGVWVHEYYEFNEKNNEAMYQVRGLNDVTRVWVDKRPIEDLANSLNTIGHSRQNELTIQNHLGMGPLGMRNVNVVSSYNPLAKQQNQKGKKKDDSEEAEKDK